MKQVMQQQAAKQVQDFSALPQTNSAPYMLSTPTIELTHMSILINSSMGDMYGVITQLKATNEPSFSFYDMDTMSALNMPQTFALASATGSVALLAVMALWQVYIVPPSMLEQLQKLA